MGKEFKLYDDRIELTEFDTFSGRKFEATISLDHFHERKSPRKMILKKYRNAEHIKNMRIRSTGKDCMALIASFMTESEFADFKETLKDEYARECADKVRMPFRL